MDIQVKNAVTNIEFIFHMEEPHWVIRVNGITLKEWTTYYAQRYKYHNIKYCSLNEAVKEAKNRGLLPKNFKAESLQQSATVTITP